MKQILKKLSVLIVLVLTLVLTLNVKVASKNELNDSPYNTYSVGLDNTLSVSPLAYEGVSVLNFNFYNPKDIFIDQNDLVYVVDTNKEDKTKTHI